ncbi:MAG: FtsK/SpoIIIE domain-containing protein [Microbacteriaceae bacterium]
MRVLFTLEDATSRRSANVYLDADGAVPTAEILTRARRELALDLDAVGPTTAYVGLTPLDPSLPLAEAGIRDGAVITLAPGGYAPAPLRSPSVVELRLVSGPGAGTIHRCGAGIVAIGSADAATITLPEPLPEIALMVTVPAAGAVLLAPVNGFTDALLEGEPLTAERQWRPGEQLQIGGALIELHLFEEHAAHLRLADDGSVFEYNRPPRLLPPEGRTTFALPSPPGEPPARGLNILAALTPLAAAGVSAIALHNYLFLLIAVLSPVVVVVGALQQRRSGRRSHRQRVDAYRELRGRIEADAAEALARERQEWLAAAPDPAAVYEIATAPLPLLWARRRADPDHLVIRVGTATQPSRVTLDDPEELAHRRSVSWDARDVPALVNLRERGVIGIAGDDGSARSVGRWAVAQLAVLQSPKDVRLYLLTESRRGAEWEWLAWLPHARGDNPTTAMTNIGTSTATTARCVAEIIAIIDGRREAGIGQGRSAQAPDDVVVVMDGARRLRAMPSLVRILREGPAVGVYSICLDADERLLPEECDAIVIVDGMTAVTRQQRVNLVDGIRPDLVGEDWLEWVARSIAPVRDASPDATSSDIPAASRLLDVLALDPPSSATIQARWLAGGRSTTAVIGESIDGEFALDLRLDGPHGLIAGTTGSGKSELLQTVVAALAIANRPEEMNFVLVDYKGGAAFKDCVELPHTVGMVTDLDTHQVERALASLSAELRTREHILAEAGAKDLEDYQALQATRRGLPSVPRLLIVIDEFASMVRELPDFVKGLVNIAQRGRSLGIHLILATQRPGGVVSPEIRANTNLRIALRMTDASESADVINAPDAAAIAKTTPGRAFVRLGAASLMPFQSARVGGRFPGAAGSAGEEPAEPLVADVSFGDLSAPAPLPEARRDGIGDVETTDLTVLVEAIRRAATDLGCAEQRKPWLPPLPTRITLDELPAGAGRGAAGADRLVLAIGLEDHPALQGQLPTLLDLDELGHLFVIGSARSGRSQALRTIAGAAASAAAVGDVHLYGIDCGNGGLLPLAALPHCGVVAQRHESERVARLLQSLVDLVGARQTQLSAHGFGSITEQRTAAAGPERLPHVIVLIDQWEGFLATLGEVAGGALLDQVTFLLREGASVGIHLVIAGDRSLFSSRMSTLVDRKILLNLADRGEYSSEGVNGKKLPEEIPPGRGFWNQSAVEVQVALLTDAASAPDEQATGPAQAAALRAIGERARAAMTEQDRDRRPFRIDALPAHIDEEDAWRLVPEPDRRPGFALVGVGGDELTGYGAALFDDEPVFLVGGAPRSGRSTLLTTMARSLLRGGVRLLLFAPRPSPLRALADEPGVIGLVTDADPAEADIAALLPADATDTVVVIDDGELLRETGADPVFRALLATGRERRLGLVLGGLADEIGAGFRGWQVEAKKSRRGILLSPRSLVEGELLGIKLSRNQVGGQPQPGRGLYLGQDLTARPLQLPQLP